MKKVFLFILLIAAGLPLFAQSAMTPELLWQLGRVSGTGVSRDGKSVVYRVTTPSIEANNTASKSYIIPVSGGAAREITNVNEFVQDKNASPGGKFQISTKAVKVFKVAGPEFYPDMAQSQVQVYTDLMYRHWDTWEDGAFSHLFVKDMASGTEKDIMSSEPHSVPGEPFGGESDYTWSPDSRFVVYSTVKKYGVDYAVSTNSDLYAYEVATGKTSNLTEGMMGYDTQPLYSSTGTLAWLSMKRDGYESDKNDIVVRTAEGPKNLTAGWDGTVSSFTWSADGAKIFFRAPLDGTIQLFEIDPAKSNAQPRQITKGDFDVTGIIGQSGKMLVVSRTDMNHAAELFTVAISDGKMAQLTHVNDAAYAKIGLSKIERRYFTTTDNKKMLTLVIYPPNFDATKKYPTLLYCQGGPQSPLSQFYSFRWNFQLMAANGYIIVAPNRHGMQGHGVAWNEEISKDWGGQAMEDYLTAIDNMAKEPFVDRARLGCVGASFGGYSVFYLAGIHNGRFKTFISHDGVFDLKSMYGTTEELWFVNWDVGGPWWDAGNDAAVVSYNRFDPSAMVDHWDTPIMIVQGGRDYRVPIGQGLAAFQAAQLQGIKSKLLYFPEENHWILHPQNAIVWQREFFKWLSDTL